MYLLILESVGSTELLVILGAALVFFGPRRLPQLSRQLGKGLSEFRRASEDFKQTWSREVNLENIEKGAGSPPENSILDKATERIRAARESIAFDSASPDAASSAMTPSVRSIDPALVHSHTTETTSSEAPATDQPPPSKNDWL